jgi:tetratricopeptide (TPR) repeat protein
MAEASGDVPAEQRLLSWIHALSWQSYFGRALGRREWAGQLQQEALALLGQPELLGQDTRRERALLLAQMGHTVLMSDYGQAEELFRQSLALYRELGDDWRMAWTLNFLGDVVFLTGAHDQAGALYRESLAISQSLGDESAAVWSTAALADVAMKQGQFVEAERLARSSSTRSLGLGDRELIAYSLLMLGQTLQPLGRCSEAHSVLVECLASFEDLGRSGWQASAHAELAGVHLHLGEYDRAGVHAATGLALARETGIFYRIGHTLSLLGAVALVEGAPAEAQRLLEDSIASYEEAGGPDDLACAHAIAACVACELGDLVMAEWHLSKALEISSKMQYALPAIYLLPALARFRVEQGRPERAVEVYEVGLRYPLVAQSDWFGRIAGAQVSAAGAALSSTALEAARERGQGQDWSTIASEV